MSLQHDFVSISILCLSPSLSLVRVILNIYLKRERIEWLDFTNCNKDN